MKAILITLCLAAASFGQSAKVVALDPSDTEKLVKLNKEISDLQKQLADARASIKAKYLVTKDNTGTCSAGREGVKEDSIVFSDFGGSGVVSGSTLHITSDGAIGWSNDSCPTEDQLKARRKAEAAAKRDRDDYDLKHPYLYYKAGWGCGQFEFSEDYKYIVPAKEEPAKQPYWFLPYASPASVPPGTITLGSWANSPNTWLSDSVTDSVIRLH